MQAPQPGDFCVVRTSGIVAWLIRFFTRSKWNHAAILVAPGVIMEARPWAGVSTGEVREYSQVLWSHVVMPPEARKAVVQKAIRLKGTKYNFLDIIGQLVVCCGIHAEWIRRRLTDDTNTICSQYVVECYWAANLTLVPGKASWEVTPGDLADVINGIEVPRYW